MRSAISSKSPRRIHARALLVGALFISSGCGRELSAPVLTEDFSSASHFDNASSTGLWNLYDHQAQAPFAANGNSAWQIDFGDGRDGAVDTADGYIFDTDAHPGAFQFQSLRITGGTIIVRGSNPLIIQSLGPVTLNPSVDLRGENASASTGGESKAAPATGGSGGAAGADGVPGNDSAGSPDASTAGTGSGSGAVSSGSNASAFPAPDFDTGGFISGTGGGGGGGNFDGADSPEAVGGGGGGAGGRLRISALGPIVLGSVDASGGVGADGMAGVPSGLCSGAGSGGGGGAVWLQTPQTITALSAPTVSGGAGVTVHACGTTPDSSDGWPGSTRADAPVAGQPGWGAGNKTVDPITGTYTLQSTAYDLGTLNAEFAEAPVISSSANGGTVSVSFAGSRDGTTFGAFTSEIAELSDQNFRYLKFKIELSYASGASPTVSKIQIPYREKGIESPNLTLSAGCGTLADASRSRRGGGSSPQELLLGLFYVAAWIAAARMATRTLSRGARSK